MVNAKKKRAVLVQQLKRYSLCGMCSARNGGLSRLPGRCEICRGLMSEIGAMADAIFSAVKSYDFATFLIGAVLPTQVYDREDALRARLKIRGRESIKSQLTRELGMKISRVTKKRVDYLRPDLTISIGVDKENSFQISTRTRPLVFAGRYVKKTRGLPQKQSRCEKCEGKGCPSCDNSGLSGYNSIEGIIAQRLINATGGKTPRFSWVGGEDQDSLVLNRGRPFIAQIFDPKKRTFEHTLRAKRDGISSVLTLLPHGEVSEAPRFTVRTRILVGCEKEITAGDIRKLKSLAGQIVTFETRSKVVAKNIYSVHAMKKGDRQFLLYLKADGGLGIKQFVGGEQTMSASVSRLLDARCECITFDILSVTFLSDETIERPPA